MAKFQFQREIRLDTLVGVDEEGHEIAHALEQIFLNGKRVGYVGHEPLAPITIIAPGVTRDRDTLQAILAKVNERLGAGDRKIAGVAELTTDAALDEAEGIVTTTESSAQPT